jgi:hypothetical protein
MTLEDSGDIGIFDPLRLVWQALVIESETGTPGVERPGVRGESRWKIK